MTGAEKYDHEKKGGEFDLKLAQMGVRIKDSENNKVREDVFDEVTLIALYKLAQKKWFSVFGGSISTGKEANVFYGERDDQEIAIKIYRIRTATFTKMSTYMIGDRRFSQIKKAKKELVFAWTRKEYSNLSRAREAGISTPEPLVFDRNILILSFLGKNSIAFPQLRVASLTDPEGVYKKIVREMERLYKRAGLIHADLSEFNILMDGDLPYLIDMGQSVTRDHPRALEFLSRDIRNITQFFKNRCDVREEKEIFLQIAGDEFQGP